LDWDPNHSTVAIAILEYEFGYFSPTWFPIRESFPIAVDGECLTLLNAIGC
jgi:hypothetical protein